MTDELTVIMGGSIAGAVTRLRGGRLRFDYDEAYAGNPAATPLSVSMPIEVRSHSDHVVTPWLWGLLPDNDAVLERWARQFHVSVSSPFALLATQVGEDCAGAVQFSAPGDAHRLVEREGTVQWLDAGQVARRLRELKADATAWLGQSFSGQFSLAGAQTKTALRHEDRRGWGTPHGSAATTHILKPAIAGLDDHDLNEHLCLAAARLAGLFVADTRVARFEDQTAIVVRRYDRHWQGNTLVRIHQEDLCQALSVAPARKYERDDGPGVRAIATLLARVMPSQAAEEATARFADALIWNWIIAGTDAHAKNYSLLLSGGQVRLAPLYDVASALPYLDPHKARFAMKLGGDYRVVPFNDTWDAAAVDLGVDAEALHARVWQLLALTPDMFAQAAHAADVVELGSDLPARLTDLVASRATWCRKLLEPGRPSRSRGAAVGSAELVEAPLGAVTAQMDTDDLLASALELARRGDAVALRYLVNDARVRAADLVGHDEIVPELALLLDKLVSLAAAFMTYELNEWRDRTLALLPRIYSMPLRPGDARRFAYSTRIPGDEVAPHVWLELLVRVEALGSLAVRERAWAVVRSLSLQQPAGLTDYDKNWLRHAVTMTSRAQLLPEDGGLLALAGEAVMRLPALHEDVMPRDEEAVPDSVAQFDFLWNVASALAAGEVNGSTCFPSFAYVEQAHVQPIADELVASDAMRDALGAGDDAALAWALRELGDLAQRQGMGRGGFQGWYGTSVGAFIEGPTSAG
jgi:serine/threonine-protein kinase HipA